MSNRNTLKQKMKNYLNHPGSLIMMLLVMFGAILTFLVLIFLIVYILVHGVPYLKPSLFSLHYTSENASLMPAPVSYTHLDDQGEPFAERIVLQGISEAGRITGKKRTGSDDPVSYTHLATDIC